MDHHLAVFLTLKVTLSQLLHLQFSKVSNNISCKLDILCDGLIISPWNGGFPCTWGCSFFWFQTVTWEKQLHFVLSLFFFFVFSNVSFLYQNCFAFHCAPRRHQQNDFIYFLSGLLQKWNYSELKHFTIMLLIFKIVFIYINYVIYLYNPCI